MENQLVRVNNQIPIYTREMLESEVIGIKTNEVIEILKYKMNLIMQGPPGVGKTYSAKRLCWYMMGCKDNSRITQVQFHSSYSYEDFIKGLKPTESGGFKLENGPFYNLCVRASHDRQRPYFLIIDEINRGNISSILGEMFSLIEKSHRDEPVTLKYNNERFAVPRNIFIIGTMNTADRGLTMLDYALRRRFSFYTMHPAFDEPEFTNKMQSHCNKKLMRVIRKIKELNKEISSDDLLGPGFMIGHSYFCTDVVITDSILSNIIEFEIIPLIEEYWYDDVDKKAEKWSNALRSILIQ